MGAFDNVAEEVNNDGAGVLPGIRIMQLIETLAKLAAREMEQRASTVDAERFRREGLKLIESLAEQLCKKFEEPKLIESLAEQLCKKIGSENPGWTGNEDEVFRIEVRHKMVEIIEKKIEIAAAQAYKKFRSRPNGLSMEKSIKQQIFSAAVQILKKRWARTEEGVVVSLKRDFQTAADHEVAQLKKELEITKACLSSANKQFARFARFAVENEILKKHDDLLERCAELEEENESKEKRCAELEEENRASHKKHDDLLERCAELEEENRLLTESKEKRCAELEEEIRLLRESKERLCAELEEEIRLLRASKERLCAELEEEIRLLRGSRQREDSPEDGDLADTNHSNSLPQAGPNSVSPSNSGLQVSPQDPAEGAAVRVETTPAPTDAERSETKELKEITKLFEAVTFFVVSVLLSLLTFHRENESAEPQTPIYKAFEFSILVTFACGLSISMLTICASYKMPFIRGDFCASYKMPIIRGLVYATRVFLVLSGVFVCIVFMKAIDLLAFVPVIVVVIVACIIAYRKNRVSAGQALRTNQGLLP